MSEDGRAPLAGAVAGAAVEAAAGDGAAAGLALPRDGGGRSPARLHRESAHRRPRAVDAVVSVWRPAGRKRSLFPERLSLSVLVRPSPRWTGPSNDELCSVCLPKASLKPGYRCARRDVGLHTCVPRVPCQLTHSGAQTEDLVLGTQWPRPVSSGSAQRGLLTRLRGRTAPAWTSSRSLGSFSKRLTVSRAQGTHVGTAQT